MAEAHLPKGGQEEEEEEEERTMPSMSSKVTAVPQPQLG